MDRSHSPIRENEQIVAIGLLTQHDLDMLGSGFRRAFHVDETPCFEDLLRAIDDADARRTPQGD